MSDEIERLLVRVEANAAQFEAQMKKVNRALYGSSAETRKTLDRIKRETAAAAPQLFKPIGDSFKREMAGLASGLAGAFAAKQVVAFADAYTQLQNRLKAAGLEGERLKWVEDQLYDAAGRNGVAIDAVAQMYQRVSQARQSLGASDEQLIALTNGVTAALRVQGVSAQQASGPLLQLGQALSGGTVRAEELNSLLEGTPVLLQAAANGSAKFGGDMAKLSTAIRDGEVSSRDFFSALLAGLPQIEAAAGKLPLTVGSALQSLNDALGRYVGQADSGLSATQRMAAGIQTLADNLDKIIPVVVALIGLIGTQYVLALTKSTAALVANGVASLRLAGFQTAMIASMTGTTAASVAASGAMARLNAVMAANPIGAVVVAVAALSAGIVLLGNRLEITGTAYRSVEAANTALTKATDAYAEAANIAAMATGKEAEEARKAAWHKRELAVNTRDAAKAKLAEAAATVALINAEAQRMLDLERRAPLRGDRPGSLRTIGRERRQQAADAEVSAAASRAAIAAANKSIADADAVIKRSEAASAAAAAPAAGARGSTVGRSVADDATRAAEELQRDLARIQDSLLTDAETAAKELAEKAEIIRKAVAQGLLTTTEGARLQAAVAGQDLTLPDRPDVNPIEVSRDITHGVADGLRAEQQSFIDQGRNMAVSFVDILRSGNIGEEIGRRFQDAAFNGIEDILSTLFSSLLQANASGGGNWMSNIAAAFSKNIPGFSAGTNSAPGGPAYVHRGEVLMNLPKGTSVIPAHAVRAMGALAGRTQVQARPAAQPVIVQLSVDEGAMFVPRVQGISGQVAIQTTATGVAYSQDQQRTQAMRRRQSLIG